MSTLEEIKYKIVFVLGDNPNESTDLSDELLLDAVHAALDAILPGCWKPASYNLVGANTSYAAPTTMYEPQAVFDNNLKMFIDPAVLAPGEPGANISGNAWFEYPNGYITFYTALTASGGILYYASQWAKPTVDSTELETPDYATNALVMYGASYAILNKAAAAAKLGNYRTRLDSGDPTDQPLKDFSTYLLKRFDIEMNRMPKQIKGVR